jgi:Protein of unknown function (DUF4229)
VAIGGGNSGHSASRAFFAYNLCRAGLLAVCLGVAWIAGLRGFALIAAALLVSGALSWFLLRNQRVAMGQAVARTVERSRVKLAEKTAAEDSYVDSLHAENSAAEDSAATQKPDQPTS